MDIYVKQEPIIMAAKSTKGIVRQKDGTIRVEDELDACFFPSDTVIVSELPETSQKTLLAAGAKLTSSVPLMENLTDEVMNMPLHKTFTLIDRYSSMPELAVGSDRYQKQATEFMKNRIKHLKEEKPEEYKKMLTGMFKMGMKEITYGNVLTLFEQQLRDKRFGDETEYRRDPELYKIPIDYVSGTFSKQLVEASNPSLAKDPKRGEPPFTPAEYKKIQRLWKARDCAVGIMLKKSNIKRIDKVAAWYQFPYYETSYFSGEKKFQESGRIPTIFRLWNEDGGSVALIQDGRENKFALCDGMLGIDQKSIMGFATSADVPKKTVWECLNQTKREVEKVPDLSEGEIEIVEEEHLVEDAPEIKKEYVPRISVPSEINAKLFKDIITEKKVDTERAFESKELRRAMIKARRTGQLITDIKTIKGTAAEKYGETSQIFASPELSKKEVARIAGSFSDASFIDLLSRAGTENPLVPINVGSIHKIEKKDRITILPMVYR